MSMAWLISPGIDAVIGVTLAEILLLSLLFRASGRGVAPRDLLPNALAGLSLMLALRCAVHEAGTAWIALCLMAAGLAHAADLARRWRRASTSTRRAPVPAEPRRVPP